MWPALILLGSAVSLSAQVASYYRSVHQKLFSVVKDTTDRRWLAQLRTTMENLRKVEWNDRFFREIAALYLEAPDEIAPLLDSLRYETGIRGALLEELWQTLRDADAAPDYLLSAWKAFLPFSDADTTLEGAILGDLLALGEASIEAWFPTGAPLTPLVEATWIGYLRGLWAAYRFMGFRDSPENWRLKYQVITTVGLLEYYAYGEVANRYRAWKRGYWH